MSSTKPVLREALALEKIAILRAFFLTQYLYCGKMKTTIGFGRNGRIDDSILSVFPLRNYPVLSAEPCKSAVCRPQHHKKGFFLPADSPYYEDEASDDCI
jgi:hypothetical protein